jgi:hypothetical protein
VEEDSDSDTKVPATNVQEVKDLINKSLRLFAADEVGKPDFALESSGEISRGLLLIKWASQTSL